MATRQARYQAKRRAEAGGQVAFFPTDRGQLDHAVRSSGKTRQAWLTEAIEEKAARQRMTEAATSDHTIDPETTRAAQAFLERVSRYHPVSSAILFGSRARGTHRTDSDADIAVVLGEEWGARSTLTREMSRIAFDVFLETGVLVEALPLRQDELDHPKSFSNPKLIDAIRRDGVRL